MASAATSPLATASGDGRDRYVDFIRAFSLLVVVAWHWVFTIIIWDDDGPTLLAFWLLFGAVLSVVFNARWVGNAVLLLISPRWFDSVVLVLLAGVAGAVDILRFREGYGVLGVINMVAVFTIPVIWLFGRPWVKGPASGQEVGAVNPSTRMM